MDSERLQRLSDIRASIGTFSDFSQNNDGDEIDDPISAYFKQRCGNSSKTFFKKHRESNSDSSIGIIDVENVSLFGDGEEHENQNLRFSENLPDQFNRDSLNVKKAEKKMRGSDALKILVSESELDKQRALAQRALRRLSKNESQNESSIMTPKKRDSKALADISSKLINVKPSTGKSSEKEWLEPKCSPNTPRYFNDELSSFGGEDENPLVKNDVKDDKNEGVSKKRQSQYTRKINSMIKELTHIPVTSDMGFEIQSKEEQINRFEEDEKKFKLENSALLHNSQISQFSGIVGEEMSQWPAPKVEAGTKNLSIGQFFNMRSNRVSSLVGSAADGNSLPNLNRKSEAPTLTDIQDQHLSKSEFSLPISEISHLEMPKFRRCLSTYDLKRIPEVGKSMRYSSDSCSSNSTALIQDILADMEPGLTGTQIYEKLMKSYGRREKEGREHKEQKPKKNLENNETPKSSKEPKRKEMVKNNKKEVTVNEWQKGSEISLDKPVRDMELNEAGPSPKNEKVKKAGSSKGFYASTPKTQAVKPHSDIFKTDNCKALMNNETWGTPRAISIQSVDINRSRGSEDNDKTVTINSTISSELNKKNSTVVINDTLTIEDTIVAGDLTVLSQRIEDMKRDSVCIVRSAEAEEPVLLSIIQKLADLPKGSIDCSALTPLLRDQFPELLSNFPSPSVNPSVNVLPGCNVKAQAGLVALPGSWVKLPGVWGLKEKIYACADLQKTVLLPIVNISSNWLLISVESLDLVHPQGKKLPAVRRNNEWFVMDFVVVTFKETIIPPENRQSFKVLFKSKVVQKLELMLTFSVKELMNGEVQTRGVRLLINNVHPENYLSVLPKEPINFGIIADQCYDQRTVQVNFDGISELPLTVYIEEDESMSKHFLLKPCAGSQHEKELEDNMYNHVFHEGEKQKLEFQIFFQPNILLNEDSKTHDFQASLVLMLGSTTDTDGVLRKIPIRGSVGFAKFCSQPSCTPIVFRVSETGQSVTKSYRLKNMGSLPIAFSILMMNEDHVLIEGEDVFAAPKSFYLSTNEESSINITFSARNKQNFTKRFMRLQIQPNGRVIYEIELIGLIGPTQSRPTSRASSTSVSVSTKSAANSDSAPVKLLTTVHSLSWAAVSLEKEARQSFQIKSVSTVPVSVRVSIEKNLDAFKLVNENGEKVNKVRRVLKPDCPFVLTVSFRPDVVGAHNTAMLFETSHGQNKKVLLNGIGGIPNLRMTNVKTDLNGCKILRLQNSRTGSQFENDIQFTNVGRIAAFLLIKPGVRDFSLSHDLIITPFSVVIPPDLSVTVKISQKLRNDDLRQLLKDREICKIATVCVVVGDEPSRQRIKKLVKSERLQVSERLKSFTDPFQGEKEIQLKNFKDSQGFENEFLKSLKVHEIAIVVERNGEILEPSILEETTDEFISFMSEKTTKSCKPTKAEPEPQKSTRGNPLEVSATFFSAEMLKTDPSHNRVTKWLETLDCV